MKVGEKTQDHLVYPYPSIIICLSAYLPTCLSVYLSIYLLYLSVYLYNHLSISTYCLSIYFIYLYIYIYLFIYLLNMSGPILQLQFTTSQLPRCAELLHVLCRSTMAARPECQPALLEGCARRWRWKMRVEKMEHHLSLIVIENDHW